MTRFIRALFFIFTFIALPVLSEESHSTATPQHEQAAPFPLNDQPVAEKDEMSFTMQFVNMLMTLGLLIAVVLLASWFLKRMMRTRVQQVNQNSSIKILEQRALTHKTMINLIEIAGKTVAFAESTNGVTLLCEFPHNEMESPHE